MTRMQTTPKITVAVPVYNEAELLRGTLETLRAQTFQAIEVLIYDNASTDDTPAVAAEFVARDPRFHYFRQPRNKGVLANFHDSLLAAKSPYFLWRAADDRSDSRYLEVLCKLLDGNPQKSLAVGTVVSSDLDGLNERRFDFPTYKALGNLGSCVRLMYASHASWIYGLFRREELTQRMNVVMQSYGHPWGFDHLVLLPFLIDNAVVGTQETKFRQIIKRSRNDSASRPKRKQADLAKMLELRGRFMRQACDDISVRSLGARSRLTLKVVMWFYTGKRVYKLRKVWRRKLFSKHG